MNEPSASVTKVVAAPRELLWDLISDVSRMGEWSPENLGGQWITGTPGAVGARFKSRNRRGRSTWSTTCEVIAAQRGEVFAFGVGKPTRFSTTWRYDLTALPDGNTEVRESYTLRRPMGAVSRLITRLTTGVTDRAADLEDGMRRTLDALAATAESEGAQRVD